MGVDETRNKEMAGSLDAFSALKLAEPRDASVCYRNIDFEPFLGECREHLGTGDDEIRGRITARDVDEMRTIIDSQVPSSGSRKCSGRTGTRVRSRPDAVRNAVDIAGAEAIAGGSPTPFRPYGAEGSPSSSTSICTGGMSRIVGIK